MTNIAKFPNIDLIEEEASLWVVKFEGDEEPSAADIAALNIWMEQSTVHKETLLKLAASWNDMDALSRLAIPIDNKNHGSASWFKPLFAMLLTPFRALKHQQKQWGVLITCTLAMSVIALAISLFIPLQYFGQQDNHYLTKLGEQSSHLLSDGSTLWLNTNSEVQVMFDTNLRRLNLYKGEVHFKVAHDANRPFEVYVGDRLVRAVGTAFSVFKSANKVKVTVTEGKVDLAVVVHQTLEINNDNIAKKELSKNLKTKNEPKKTEVLNSLIAGQTISMSTDNLRELDEIVDVEQQDLKRRLSWLEGQLVFAGESLAYVVEEVSRYTSVHIEVVDSNLDSLRIGGQFQVGKTDELFDVLESSFGVKISRLDEKHVQIHAK